MGWHDSPVGILVIASLVIKKQLEKRKRSWRIWFLDVSKQLVGQAVVHALNLIVRFLNHPPGAPANADMVMIMIMIMTDIRSGSICGE